MRRELFLCATAALLLSGCARKQSDELETVRIASRRHLAAAPVYIADEEGYFAEEGIRLEFVDAPARSMQAIPLLEQGRIDVLGASVSSGLFAAVRSRARLRIVADRGHVGGNCDFNGVIGAGATFLTDSPTTAQVRGRTFSINATTTPEFITDRFLASRGLVTKDVKVVSLSETVEPQALAEWCSARDLQYRALYLIACKGRTPPPRKRARICAGCALRGDRVWAHSYGK